MSVPDSDAASSKVRDDASIYTSAMKSQIPAPPTVSEGDSASMTTADLQTGASRSSLTRNEGRIKAAANVKNEVEMRTEPSWKGDEVRCHRRECDIFRGHAKSGGVGSPCKTTCDDAEELRSARAEGSSEQDRTHPEWSGRLTDNIAKALGPVCGREGDQT
jgi:hypothetical protein